MPSYEQVHLAVDRIPPGPWVYARLTDDYGPDGPVARDGSIVEVIDREGRFCGHALYNSTSDIRLRMLSRGRRSDLDRPRQHLQRLIAAGAHLDLKRSDGSTPLIVASYLGHAPAVAAPRTARGQPIAAAPRSLSSSGGNKGGGAVAVGGRGTTGVARDSVPLKLWATNTGGRAVNATIGRDPVPWPDARPGLHVHFSPECTPLSKARSGGASRGEVDAALDAVRACLELAVRKGYESWSLENVGTPAVVRLVDEVAARHPSAALRSRCDDLRSLVGAVVLQQHGRVADRAVHAQPPHRHGGNGGESVLHQGDERALVGVDYARHADDRVVAREHRRDKVRLVCEALCRFEWLLKVI